MNVIVLHVIIESVCPPFSDGGKTNFTSLSRTCSTTPQDQTVSEDGLQLCDAIISPNIGNIEDTIPNDFLRSSMEGEETTTLVLKGFLFYSYFIVILSYAIPAPKQRLYQFSHSPMYVRGRLQPLLPLHVTRPVPSSYLWSLFLSNQ
uniref:Uncharacterized protein n=1 Tax=Labrus bergylta TaxID=56723 RepID=A0A3Q3L0Z9_9LABR